MEGHEDDEDRQEKEGAVELREGREAEAGTGEEVPPVPPFRFEEEEGRRQDQRRDQDVVADGTGEVDERHPRALSRNAEPEQDERPRGDEAREVSRDPPAQQEGEEKNEEAARDRNRPRLDDSQPEDAERAGHEERVEGPVLVVQLLRPEEAGVEVVPLHARGSELPRGRGDPGLVGRHQRGVREVRHRSSEEDRPQEGEHEDRARQSGAGNIGRLVTRAHRVQLGRCLGLAGQRSPRGKPHRSSTSELDYELLGRFLSRAGSWSLGRILLIPSHPFVLGGLE